MLVVMRPIGSIRPYENNPRLNDAAVDAVARSIQEFGFRQPLVVDEAGVILVGHTRHKAALQLKMTEIPVHVAVGLSPEQAKAYRIADNQTATLASWDDDKLVQELAQLQEMDFDVALTGFSEEDLQRLLGPVTEALTDPDDIPEPPDEAITQPGDLWLLGHHRLLCGDSGNSDDVDRLLDGAAIHVVHTDPPYNVRVEPRSNNAIAAGLSSFPGTTHHQGFDVERYPKKATATHKKMRAKDRPLANDFVSEAEFDRLLHAWFGNMARLLQPGRAAYIWGGYANIANYPAVLKAVGLYFSQTIIWVKEHPVLTRKDFMGNHEWCFYTWREGAAHQFFGPNNATDVWSIKKVNPQSMIHLTEKPVELATRALEYSSKRGENVLDLFGGSGSTLIAAEQTERHAFLMELDPLYCDVIVQRYENFTGHKAERCAA
jgi:DNA modification methylase